MADWIRWWLLAELIGLAAFPYTFRFLRWLPDRGYTVAKPLGLLLVGYTLWLGAFSGALPYQGGTATLLVACFAAGAVFLAGHDRAELGRFLHTHLRLVVAAEVIFLVAFAGIAALRAYSPEIAATEKPFESAFFQSVLRSEEFGPRDPWFAGEPMSYYYFGYVLNGVPTALAGTQPEVAFNLALALTAGLAAIAAFGLVLNLIAGRVRRPGVAILAALLGPLLLLLVSNLEGVFELLAAHGVESPAFYRAIAIKGLEGPTPSDAWYPTEHWWWWRATRLGSDWNVQEFPFFSFLLGDLHAHVMVLPYSLLMLSVVFNLWRSGQRLDLRFLKRHPLLVAGVALVAGNLYVTNAWDFPVALTLLGLVVLARNYAGPIDAASDESGMSRAAAGGAHGAAANPAVGARVIAPSSAPYSPPSPDHDTDQQHTTALSLRPLVAAVAFLAPPAIGAVLLYLPFYIGFSAAPTELRVTEVLFTDVDRRAMATPPLQFLVFWSPLLFPAVSYLLWRFMTVRPWRMEPALLLLGALAGLLPVCLWCAAVIGLHGFVGLMDELAARGSMLITWAILVPLVIVAALVFLGEVFLRDVRETGSRPVVAAMLVLAVFLNLFADLFYIVDIVVASRHNTVFKFYYAAWLLLSVAGAAGVIDLLAAWRTRPRRVSPPVLAGRLAWGAAAVALLALALVYPLTASLARSDGFEGPATLDGLARLRRDEPDEYDAAIWLRRVADGMPVVLEAEGPEYSQAGRVSARTGFPTVIGWPNHEWQERGTLAPITARVRDVDTLYRTSDAAIARQLLDRYAVDYVYIGDYERRRYGPNAGDTLARLGRLVYEAPSVRIYAVDRDDGAATTVRLLIRATAAPQPAGAWPPPRLPRPAV